MQWLCYCSSGATRTDKPNIVLTGLTQLSLNAGGSGWALKDGEADGLLFHYLTGTKDGIRHVPGKHKMGLFTREQTEQASTETGFGVEPTSRV